MPDWFFEEPILLDHHEFYMRSFAHLSTCRQLGAAIGPIPWNNIVDYADRKDLSGDMSDAFVEIIREMDAGYLKWAAEEEKSKRAPSGVQ